LYYTIIKLNGTSKCIYINDGVAILNCVLVKNLVPVLELIPAHEVKIFASELKNLYINMDRIISDGDSTFFAYNSFYGREGSITQKIPHPLFTNEYGIFVATSNIPSHKPEIRQLGPHIDLIDDKTKQPKNPGLIKQPSNLE